MPVFTANTKETTKRGGRRPPPFVEAAEGRLLSVGCEHWAYLSVETSDMFAVLRATTSAFLRRKTFAVLRAGTGALFRANVKFTFFVISDVFFCEPESKET